MKDSTTYSDHLNLFSTSTADPSTDVSPLPDWSSMDAEAAAAESIAICTAVVAKMGGIARRTVGARFGIAQSTFNDYCRGHHTFAQRCHPGSWQRTRHILHHYLTTGEVRQTTSKRYFSRPSSYANNLALQVLVKRLHDEGLNYGEIARELETRGLKTDRGHSHWHGTSIRIILDYAREKKVGEEEKVVYIKPPKAVVANKITSVTSEEVIHLNGRIDDLASVVRKTNDRLNDAARIVAETQERYDFLTTLLDELTRPKSPPTPPAPPPLAAPKTKRRLLDLFR
jgi:hypothetical protein